MRRMRHRKCCKALQHETYFAFDKNISLNFIKNVFQFLYFRILFLNILQDEYLRLGEGGAVMIHLIIIFFEF